MRPGPGWVRTSAVPSPRGPASGFPMQFTARFHHPAPQRSVVTLGAAPSFLTFTRPRPPPRPLIDERHVMPGLGEHSSDDAPDGPRADDPDSHGHGSPPLGPSMIT